MSPLLSFTSPLFNFDDLGARGGGDMAPERVMQPPHQLPNELPPLKSTWYVTLLSLRPDLDMLPLPLLWLLLLLLRARAFHSL